jgi:rhodanese-related sulfurtransferase
MTLVDTKKATEFFEAKLNFTTGPFELSELIESDENINIIDVRKAEDYASGHIPGAISLPTRLASRKVMSKHPPKCDQRVNELQGA